MTQKVRKSLYAGSFYPSDKKELSKIVSAFLTKANSKKINKKLRALIVPHAGYIYSGSTAGFAYQVLKEASPKRVVLLGPSHHDYLVGAFGFGGEWETPLGKVKLEEPFLQILESDKEHSLEVQLPFLQRALKKFNFLPIIYGDIGAKALSIILEDASTKETIFISSSDLSHFAKYDKAVKIDETTIKAILNLDFAGIDAFGDACGKIGIAALIILAIKYNWKAVLLDY